MGPSRASFHDENSKLESFLPTRIHMTVMKSVREINVYKSVAHRSVHRYSTNNIKSSNHQQLQSVFKTSTIYNHLKQPFRPTQTTLNHNGLISTPLPKRGLRPVDKQTIRRHRAKALSLKHRKVHAQVRHRIHRAIACHEPKGKQAEQARCSRIRRRCLLGDLQRSFLTNTEYRYREPALLDLALAKDIHGIEEFGMSPGGFTSITIVTLSTSH